MRPRLAFAIGLVFAVLTVIYLFVSGDAGGATMLGCLAIGMTVMWYVLFAGSASES
jgi:hypothetical protein